ncbi:hypothetical protein [Salinibacter altiplanensis]|uniref:hypothetical protein n=1 Tax=Salinibacter altiplanensis TaxID=1803181 RepID=UPI00131A5897|nr:hypothetical protein [Salinibacter altiplanensis]
MIFDHHVTITVQNLSQYTVAGAVYLYVVGYIISVQHFSRFGVSIVQFPVTVMFGAGLSFTTVTYFFFHLGTEAVQTIEQAGVGTAVEAIGLMVLFLVTVANFLIFRPLFLTYCSLTILAGAVGAFTHLVDASPGQIVFHDPLVGIPALLLVAGAYSFMAYPNLSRALGGGAPKPVEIDLHEGHGDLIPEEKKVYEVLSTSDRLFLAIEPSTPLDPPSGETKTRLFPPIPMRWPFAYGTEFTQISREAVRKVTYTNEWESPPKSTGLAR